jgi:hypothetical protein
MMFVPHFFCLLRRIFPIEREKGGHTHFTLKGWAPKHKPEIRKPERVQRRGENNDVEGREN